MFCKDDSGPLHIQLERALLKRIESGEYGAGDVFPKEMDLVEEYGMSRITVRRALQSLTDAGYLMRTKRRGTFVQPQKVKEPLLKIQSFTQETLETGNLPATQSVTLSIGKVSLEIAAELLIAPEVEVLHIERVRCIQGAPVVLFDTFIPCALELPRQTEAYYGSLYALLRDQGVEIKKIRQHIGAALADARLAALLPCEEGDAVLVLRRTGYSQAGAPVEYTIGRYLGDRYEYYFELDETKEDHHETGEL